MSDDYYKVLGVGRGASQQEIQKAYRDAARKYHPDMNPDDKTAKEKFQQVQQAYDVLGEPEKRELYDRYGSSFETMGAGGPGGAQRGPQWRTQSGGAGPQGFEDFDFSQVFGGGTGPGGGEGFEELFRQFGGGGGAATGGTRSRKRGRKAKGADLTHDVTVAFQTAITGGKVELSIDRGDGQPKTLAITIPPGIEEGKVIRLAGQGEQVSGGVSGDLRLTMHIAPHPYFTRHGNNLEVKLPITISEAAGGAKVDVPTPHGTIALKIPPGTSSGQRLRAKGQGVRPKPGEPGDLFAIVEIVLPPNLSEEERAWLVQLGEQHPQNVRGELVW